ncbi:MAG TPA: hypothetical protein VFV99_25355 [Kofleriaceae bacterium]|nr:hypothetical protein [Kofleriaceae bacterium]
MRYALVISLAACAGCGDNLPECGFVHTLAANRNIWGGHIAVDADRVYYSDYDNGIGTHLVFRQPREGGQALVISGRDESSRFGYGMVTDDSYLYWTAEVAEAGYTLFATPKLGGASLQLKVVSVCTAHGVAVDSVNSYAGAIRCDDNPAQVVAAPHVGSGGGVIWSSTDADVSALAARDGNVVIATTNGLFRVMPTATELLDGHSTYQVVIVGDEIVYSTTEAVIAMPYAGGAQRTLYTFHTTIDQPRPFAVDGDDLYVVESTELVYIHAGDQPISLVSDMGLAITHIAAGGGAAYWPTLAVPGAPGVLDTFNGAVFRVTPPCH